MKQKRRDFIKKVSWASTFSLTSPRLIGSPFFHINPNLPVPTKAQKKWQECEIGMIFHFDISIANRVTRFDNNTNKKRLDPQKYNPTKLDTDQWVEVAKSAGAKYALFTATHFQGFMQWQSDLYPYGLKQAKWRNGKGDIVKDFVASCRKAEIFPGIYFSTHRNVFWEVWGHYVNWGKGKGTSGQAEFNKVAEKMAKELLSRYGPLLQIWMDAGVKLPHEGGPDILPIFDKYQPESVFYNSTKRSDHRWIGNESGYAGYPCWSTMPEAGGIISHNSEYWKPILDTGDPNGKLWSPGMVDVPVRGSNGVHNWFWKEDQEYGLDSLNKLVKMYYDSVGRNCNLVLGEVITPEGLVPETDVKRMKEFGNEIKKLFDKPIAETMGRGDKIKLALPGYKKIDHVVISEDITFGERIRKYKIEGKTEGGNWELLCEGQSVGNKRIQKFDLVEVSEVRLLITKNQAEPRIRSLSVFGEE